MARCRQRIPTNAGHHITYLDHIDTTHTQHVRASNVDVLSASDHLPVVMLRKRNSTKAVVPCAITYRQYKHFDAYHFGMIFIRCHGQILLSILM